MTSSRVVGARVRARQETVRAITDAARVQLGEVGAAALSVRAVTRALGMSASSVYRYFPNRDALLTALILDAYRGVGEAAARAESAVDRADLLGRWLAVHRAVRAWALDHPHEYALIYGSPVPGYVAPEDTTVPAAQVVLLLAAVAVESWVVRGQSAGPSGGDDARIGSHGAPSAGSTGASDGGSVDGVLAEVPGGTPLTEALRADLRARLDQALAGLPEDLRPEPSAIDPHLVLAVVDAWTELFGSISFELFGHFRNVVDARGDHVDATARRTAAAAGIVARPAAITTTVAATATAERAARDCT
ncbi:MAG TPA: TetR/AcrR family transcriptional regulator [Cellulomonas sp.]